MTEQRVYAALKELESGIIRKRRGRFKTRPAFKTENPHSRLLSGWVDHELAEGQPSGSRRGRPGVIVPTAYLERLAATLDCLERDLSPFAARSEELQAIQRYCRASRDRLVEQGPVSIGMVVEVQAGIIGAIRSFQRGPEGKKNRAALYEMKMAEGFTRARIVSWLRQGFGPGSKRTNRSLAIAMVADACGVHPGTIRNLLRASEKSSA